jgi:hypothetical protein
MRYTTLRNKRKNAAIARRLDCSWTLRSRQWGTAWLMLGHTRAQARNQRD